MSKIKSQNLHQIYGINGSLSLLKKGDYKIISIDIQENGIAANHSEINTHVKDYADAVKLLQQTIFKKQYAKKHTQGIVITFQGKIEKDLPQLEKVNGNYGLLIIDNVTDPQNFGQIIRTAECAGIKGIIIPERNSVGITDTVLQISQGAFCHIPIYSVTNLHQTINQLKDKDFWTVALENGIYAKPWHEIDYRGKIAIVVGSEGFGIKPIVLKACDFQATIPMQGEISSANVSAAVSAIVFERLRQIRSKVL